ncbi:MAG: arginase family protein [Lysobacterales bacterium]
MNTVSQGMTTPTGPALEMPAATELLEPDPGIYDPYLADTAHGCPFRLAVEDGLLDPKRSIQIGIRGPQNTFEGWDYSLEKGMRVALSFTAAIALTRNGRPGSPTTT